MKLLAMSGLIPEEICDLVRFRGYSGGQRIAHYCGYASEFISMVLDDPDLNGAVFPKSCDSSRTMKSYLSGCGKFVYQLHVPARQDGTAVTFFAEALRDFKESLENYFQVSVCDAEIKERIEAVAVRNRKMRELYESLDAVPYYEYITKIHNMLEQPLLEQRIPIFSGSVNGQKIYGETAGRKRVFLVGSFFANESVADRIERSGIKIVGDNLPESGRLCTMSEIDPNGDLFHGISVSMLKGRLSPTQDNFRTILERDLAEIRKKAVQGVIFVTQKFCEPYDYLYFVYKKILDEQGIPVLKISLTGSRDGGKTDLAVEAFADLL